MDALDDITLPDGRRMDVRVSGPDGGVPLCFHHGTPGGAPPVRALERAADLGLEALHLGGGATVSPDDPLLKFKRSFGGRRLPFQVARVTADVARFNALIRAWEAKEGAPPKWLLGYRQPHRVS